MGERDLLNRLRERNRQHRENGGDEMFLGPDDELILESISEIARLRSELTACREALEKERKRADRLEHAVDATARWAWRTDPPHASGSLTDRDRLSAIKYHPVIKSAAQPHIELAEREAAALSSAPSIRETGE